MIDFYFRYWEDFIPFQIKIKMVFNENDSILEIFYLAFKAILRIIGTGFAVIVAYLTYI